MLTPRWYELIYHRKQKECWQCDSRFILNHSGRRSGKTEIEKRRAVLRAIELCTMGITDGLVCLAAPTHQQAKAIYWNDLKKLVPENLSYSVRESDLQILLVTGTIIQVVGMDKPERIEGRPLDHILLDEIGNMKPGVWSEHVRPALYSSGRPPGTASLIGVPEGRGLWYDFVQASRAGTFEDSTVFNWPSSDILPKAEIAAARSSLDDLTFRQEYNGEFVSFSGRAYYAFSVEHNTGNVKYLDGGDLILCFDFNVEPGVAVICQEQIINGRQHTCVIGEVHIPKNSNTPAVCLKLLQDWAFHNGYVYIYGDPSGGQRRSSGIDGTDWDLVKKTLLVHWKRDQLIFCVDRSAPAERTRVNTVNSRCRSINGDVSLLVNPVAAPNVVKDLDGVALLVGGSGEIDKKKNHLLTHLSDALGYYIAREYPISMLWRPKAQEIGI